MYIYISTEVHFAIFREYDLLYTFFVIHWGLFLKFTICYKIVKSSVCFKKEILQTHKARIQRNPTCFRRPDCPPITIRHSPKMADNVQRE